MDVIRKVDLNEKEDCKYIENKIHSYGYKTQIQTVSLPTDYSETDKIKFSTSQNLIAIKK